MAAASEVFYQDHFWVLEPGSGCCRPHRLPPTHLLPGPYRQQSILPPDLNNGNDTVHASLLEIQPLKSIFVPVGKKRFRLKLMLFLCFASGRCPTQGDMLAIVLSILEDLI